MTLTDYMPSKKKAEEDLLALKKASMHLYKELKIT